MASDRLRAALRLVGLADAVGAPVASERPAAEGNTCSSPDGGRTAENAPGRAPKVPAAIAHDLERGLGWPRGGPGGFSQPGRGPLVFRPPRDER